VSARTDMVSRYAVSLAPFAMGILGVFLLAVPFRFFSATIPTPIIPLAVIFFWMIYDPEKLPASSVFIIGLFQDFLTGGIVGLWSTIYLIVQFVVLTQRSYFLGRELQVVMLGFSVVAVGAAMMDWLVMSLMSGYFLPIMPIMIQISATVCFYPLLGAGFKTIRRRVLVEV